MLTLLLALAYAGDPIDDAVDAAMAHPSIVAATERSAAADTRRFVAGSWSDPVLAVELSNLPASSLGLSHPMSGLQLKLSQRLSVWGTSSAAKQAATLSMHAASYRADEQALVVETGIRAKWVQAGSAHALAELTAAHRARVTELRQVATRHYEVGHGGQSALLRLGVLEQRLVDDEAQWERQAVVHEAWLSEVAGEPITVDLRPETAAVAGDAKEWAAAIDERPAVRALVAEGEAVAAEATLIRRQAIPQPTVWGGYRLRTEATDGADLVSVGVSAPIPVASARRGRQLADARSTDASALKSQATTLRQAIERDLVVVEANWTRAFERATLYADVLVPEAIRARDATLADYRVNRAAFADVLEAEVALLDLERVAILSATETQIQAALVRGLLGVNP